MRSPLPGDLCSYKQLVVVLLSVLFAFNLLSPPARGFGATSSGGAAISIVTDSPSYSGNSTVVVSGVVPLSIAGTALTVSIINPANNAVAAQPSVIDQNNGSYRAVFRAGGPGWEASGTYGVTAVVQQPDTVATPPSAATTFTYLAAAARSSTSTVSETAGAGGSMFAALITVAIFVIIAAALVALVIRSRRSA